MTGIWLNEATTILIICVLIGLIIYWIGREYLPKCPQCNQFVLARKPKLCWHCYHEKEVSK